MSIVIECNKGEGQVFGNLLRKFALMRLPSWRPIAFRIEREGTNILHSSPDILQSMLEFAQELSELQFECESNDDVVQEIYTFQGSLSSSDLTKGSVKCLTDGVPLLDLMGTTGLTVKLIFRKTYGICSANQNLNFLQEKQIIGDNSEIKVISSIHSEISKFFYKVEETTLDKENLIIDINNNYDNLDEVNSLKSVLAMLTNSIININSQVSKY